MKYKFILFLVIIPILFSCRTIKPDALKAYGNKSMNLPQMTPQINIQSFYYEIIIGTLYTTEQIEYIPLGDRMIISEDKYILKWYEDKRISDLAQYYVSDVKTNIIDSTDTRQFGYIQLDLISYEKHRMLPLTIVAASTLFSICLVGFPASAVNINMGIRLTLRDANYNIIKSYEGYGKGTAFLSMYWGYGDDEYRKANLDAFKEAMNICKLKIKEDRDYIINKLNTNKYFINTN